MRRVRDADHGGTLPDFAFVEFFERLPVPLLVRSLETEEFVAINAAFEKLFGYKRSEVIGKKPDDVGIFDPIAHHHENVVRVLTEGELIDRPVTIRCKDGRLLDVVFSTSRVYVAGEMYAVTVLRKR